MVAAVLLVTAAFATTATAQQKAINSMVIMVNGDLFEYSSGTTRQLTQWGYNGTPIISPDVAGTYIAYTSVSERYIDSGERNYAGT
ncbi:MAG: hypothetical protein AAFU54_08180 [Chloroflexota bacterium]